MIKVELQFNEKVVSYSIHYDRTINGEFKQKKNLRSLSLAKDQMAKELSDGLNI